MANCKTGYNEQPHARNKPFVSSAVFKDNDRVFGDFNNVPWSNEFPKDDFFSIHSDVTHFTLFNN